MRALVFEYLKKQARKLVRNIAISIARDVLNAVPFVMTRLEHRGGRVESNLVDGADLGSSN